MSKMHKERKAKTGTVLSSENMALMQMAKVNIIINRICQKQYNHQKYELDSKHLTFMK